MAPLEHDPESWIRLSEKLMFLQTGLSVENRSVH